MAKKTTKPEGNGGEPLDPEPTSVEPTVDVDPPPTTTPAGGQNWESAYKGLQPKFEKLQKKSTAQDVTIDELNGTIEDLKLQVKAATNEKDQIATKHVAATEKISGLEATATTATSTIERQKLIMSDFQDLAPFEAKGLLPAAQGEEEMRTVFEKFRATMGDLVTEQAQVKVQGVGPGPTDPKPIEPMDKDQLYDRMMALAGTNDPEERREYEMLNRKWMELSEA